MPKGPVVGLALGSLRGKSYFDNPSLFHLYIVKATHSSDRAVFQGAAPWSSALAACLALTPDLLG